ncbi:hypothetical protein ACWEO2_06905 [Nocardia sp. NPDC004278]
MWGFNWKSAVVFGAGFLGGPIAGPLIAGGAATLMAHYLDHKSWDEAGEQGIVAGVSAIGGHLAGGIVGGALKKLAAKKLDGAAAKIVFKGIQKKAFQSTTKKGGTVTLQTARKRVLDGKATSWGLRGINAVGRGAGAMIGDHMYGEISELPVKIIT